MVRRLSALTVVRPPTVLPQKVFPLRFPSHDASHIAPGHFSSVSEISPSFDGFHHALPGRHPPSTSPDLPPSASMDAFLEADPPPAGCEPTSATAGTQPDRRQPAASSLAIGPRHQPRQARPQPRWPSGHDIGRCQARSRSPSVSLPACYFRAICIARTHLTYMDTHERRQGEGGIWHPLPEARK